MKKLNPQEHMTPDGEPKDKGFVYAVREASGTIVASYSNDGVEVLLEQGPDGRLFMPQELGGLEVIVSGPHISFREFS